ncbi:MAG: hypothetical protein GF311_06165 [Candidatus Lokiarchaeota archaeon]|nr:hypothetical protein [Candidatus Lokiarchaeota archaeon]
MVKQTGSKSKIQNQKSKRKKKEKTQWLADVMRYAYENDLIAGYHKINRYNHNWILMNRQKHKDLYFDWFKCNCCGIIAIGKKKDKYFPDFYEYFCKPEDNLTCDEVMVRDILT